MEVQQDGVNDQTVVIMFEMVEIINKGGRWLQCLSLDLKQRQVTINGVCGNVELVAAQSLTAFVEVVGWDSALIIILDAVKDKMKWERTEECYPSTHKKAGKVRKITLSFQEKQSSFWRKLVTCINDVPAASSQVLARDSAHTS